MPLKPKTKNEHPTREHQMSSQFHRTTALPWAFFMLNHSNPHRYPYVQRQARLRDLFSQQPARIQLEPGQAWIHNLEFQSQPHPFARDEYHIRDSAFQALLRYFLDRNRYSKEYIFQSLQIRDREVQENHTFRYTIFTPAPHKARSAIFLFHGLNEKRWDKYLAWAERLMQLTGKAVVLFPIAFHMNRALQPWSDPRLMSEVSRERKSLFPDVQSSSFANAAISHRLQFAPQRFLLSGIQTFYDLVRLGDDIVSGQHPLFEAETRIDFFAYSIGALLAQILVMANPNKLFDPTRLFMFAGGAALNLIRPTSKLILDSEASDAVTSFFNKIFDPVFKTDPMVAPFVEHKSTEMKFFKSMLRSEHMVSVREKRLKQLGERIMTVALAQDQVFPVQGLQNTLKSERTKNRGKFLTLDFPFTYTHENPFPLKSSTPAAVDTCFSQVIELAGEHLG